MANATASERVLRGNPEIAARLRAAFAYARLTKAKRAEALGVGVRHVSRIESAEVAFDPRRIDGVVEATGVPRWFLEHGFEVPPEPEEPTTLERVEALEAKVDALLRALGEARKGGDQLTDDLLAIVGEYPPDSTPGSPAPTGPPDEQTSGRSAGHPEHAAPTGGHR